MFYGLDQNNSGGSFIVDDKVCHRLFIEANSEDAAIAKAEDLGCYWEGVAAGRDCPCCGDRWSTYFDDCNLEKINEKGYRVGIYDHYPNPEKLWEKKYGSYTIMESPYWENKYGFREYVGKIKFNTIEEYAQFLADEYGWTTPDVRIYYKNGDVKEIFSDNNRCK